jgi:exodeoxyribonuclease-3
VGATDVVRGLVGQPDFEGAAEPRAIGATCGGVRVWSLYCPNGREPGHDHYNYKLAWFKALNTTIESELAANPDLPFAAIGDYNVAPTDADVWDINVFKDSTHVTPAERAALSDLESIGLSEVMPRALKGEPYTFWDYRNGSFHRGWGMRIDLVFGNAAFTSRVSDSYVDREARKGKGASDHAPVVVDLT